MHTSLLSCADQEGGTGEPGPNPPGKLQNKNIFTCFPFIILCKICVSLDGAIFSPQEHNLNMLSKGPPVDTTYQISKL